MQDYRSYLAFEACSQDRRGGPGRRTICPTVLLISEAAHERTHQKRSFDELSWIILDQNYVFNLKRESLTVGKAGCW